MSEDEITEVGIDAEGRLYVRPASLSFDFMYRAGMEVNWDASNRRLFGPKPREWSYADWFRQIVAAAEEEYGVRLRLTPDTAWLNVPTSLQGEIEARPSPVEALFVLAAEQVLPVSDAQIGRTERGTLFYRWRSPYEEIGELSAFVPEHEVMLSTKLGHSHVDAAHFTCEGVGEADLPRRIVDTAIDKILAILSGKTIFSRHYDADGKQRSGGMGSLDGRPDEGAWHRETFGEGMTTRSWNWFGEVS